MAEQLVLDLPERASSREEARELLAPHVSKLKGGTVVLRANALTASSSSYIDELIKHILVDQGAAKLTLDGIAERIGSFAVSSANRRGVRHKLSITTR